MSTSRPNILLIFCDQLRADALGAYGNIVCRTPALDTLAKDSIRYDNAITPCPVCVPARHAMHTGIAPYESGCTDNGPMPYYPSFMEMLSRSGYHTHGVGKMHFELGKTEELWGFASRDISEEIQPLSERSDFRDFVWSKGYSHVKDLHGVRSEMYYIPQPSQLPAHLHNTSWVVDKSIDYIAARKDKERPFFLMTSFIKPHPPFEVPTPWNKLYRGPDMPDPFMPDGADDLLCYINRFQNRYKYRSQGIDRNLMRQIKAAYYGSVSFIDWNVGRLLDYLKQEGLYENTLILFAADHGEMLGDYGGVGKRCFLSPSMNIPLLVKPAGMPQGSVCHTPVSLIDVLPTLLNAAGAPVPSTYEGRDLVSVAHAPTENRSLYGQFGRKGEGLYMARDLQYKYIYSAPDGKEWLFSLSEGKKEEENLAAQYPDICREMRRRMAEQFRLRRGDSCSEIFAGEDFCPYPRLSVDAYDDKGLLFQDAEGSLPTNLKEYR